MALAIYIKHPDAIIAIPIIVRNLGANTIGAVSGASIPSGLTVGSVTASGNTVTALISGGTNGITYQLEVTINISNGERRIVEISVPVVDN